MGKKLLVIILSLVLLTPGYATKNTKKVKLPAGTAITIRTISKLDSQKPQKRTLFVVNGDIWDENGEVILIKEGTPADVQIFMRKATIYGEKAIIQFQPISTKAFNGRLIGFKEQKVVFSGGNYKRQKKVILPEGTSFCGYTANDLYFNIEVNE
ncbi:MAG: hypothetical protein ACI3ZZ_02510 [Candidatus Aphodosoma sp.]